MINQQEEMYIPRSTASGQFSIVQRGGHILNDVDLHDKLTINNNRVYDILDGDEHFDDNSYNYRCIHLRSLFCSTNIINDPR